MINNKVPANSIAFRDKRRIFADKRQVGSIKAAQAV